MRVRKGDVVVVTTGKDKGKQGKILNVLLNRDRVVVEGINEVKRHSRPTGKQPGGIVTKNQPIHVSNIALIDPKTSKPTRVGYKFIEGDSGKKAKKVRFSKRSNETIK